MTDDTYESYGYLQPSEITKIPLAPEFDRVQCVFEFLPFRPGIFGSAVAGFSLRDSQDLETALTQIRRAVRPGGRFAFCDLGKPRDRARRKHQP